MAFTRPENRLYVLSKISEKGVNKDNIRHIGELLYLYLEHAGLIKTDNSFILNKGIKNEKKKEKPQNSIEKISLASNNIDNKPKIRLSADNLDTAEDLARAFSADKGNKIHLLLSKIKNKNDIAQAIKSNIEAGNFSEIDAVELKLKLTELLEIPILRNYFEISVKAKNELDILLPNGKSQRPDRVVFNENETIIIDYKSGIEKPEHKSQIRNYATLLREMIYPNPKMILVYLETLKVIIVD